MTDLALATHHHDDPAHVQTDVPEGVSVGFNDAGTRVRERIVLNARRR